MRAHEHAFTFGSSTSTFFQLHIVNCTGLGEEKVKAAAATLRLEQLQVRRRTPTAVKTGVCTVDPSVACDVLWSLSAFCILWSRSLPLVLDCSWSLFCVYLHQVQYDQQNFVSLHQIASCVSTVKIITETCRSVFFLLRYFALLKLLSLDVASAPNYPEPDRTYCSWSFLHFPHCCHIYLHYSADSSLSRGMFSSSSF